MKNINQLREEHAAQIAKLEREIAIAGAMPIAPDSVMATGREAWVMYRGRKTLMAALDVFRAFQIVPFEVWRNSCTSLRPYATLSEKEKESHSTDGATYAVSLEVNQGEGFGPNAELIFYAQTDAGIVRVSVKFGNCYIGMASQLSAKFDSVKHGNRVIRIESKPNTECRALSDYLIKWSTGGNMLERSARFDYLFCADSADTVPGAKHSHAIAQLSILAERANV